MICWRRERKWKVGLLRVMGIYYVLYLGPFRWSWFLCEEAK